MITLGKEQIKRLHKKLLEETSGLDGLRDESMLDSALSVAFQTFDSVELYPSTAAKIARTAIAVLQRHAKKKKPVTLAVTSFLWS